MPDTMYRVEGKNRYDNRGWWGFYLGDSQEYAIREFLQLVSMGREARIHAYEVPDAIVR
jgi:hypothetical protein